MFGKVFTKDGSDELKRKAKNMGIMLATATLLAMPMKSAAQNGSTAENLPNKPKTEQSYNSAEVKEFIDFVRENFIKSNNPEQVEKGKQMLSDKSWDKALSAYHRVKAEHAEKEKSQSIKEDNAVEKHKINSNGVTGTYSLSVMDTPEGKKFQYATNLSMTGVNIDYRITGHNASMSQKSRCRNAFANNEVYKDILKRTENGAKATEAERLFIKSNEKEMQMLNLERTKDGKIKNKDVGENDTMFSGMTKGKTR